jgi:ATP-binding cassette subfamily F protein uup
VLIVSHDRDFLDRTVTITLGLDGSGDVDIIAGGYADWEAKRKRPVSPVKSAKAPAQTRPDPEQAAPPPPKRSKLSYKDQRDYDMLPARIEELDAVIARGERAFADPDLFSGDPEKFARLTVTLEQARTEKDAAEERWLALAELVEG